MRRFLFSRLFRSIVACLVAAGALCMAVASSASGAGRAYSLSDPASRPDYSGVDSNSNIVVNGRVVAVGKVYRDLWGGIGIEADLMANALDLYSLTLGYRDTSLTGWSYGGFPKEWADVLTTTSCLHWGWLPDTCQVKEKEKVWLYSRMYRESMIATWDDTYANGKRVGNGYYLRDGKRILRFDEVVPAFGGDVFVHEGGLIEITMPPRNLTASDIQGCVMNHQLDAHGNCDTQAAFLPSAYGTFGEGKIFAILGWQADAGGENPAARVILRQMNLSALKLSGRTPTLRDKAAEMLDTAAFWLPVTLLIMEGNFVLASAVEFYFPEWSGTTALSVPLAGEYADTEMERDAAFIEGVQMAEADVRAIALDRYGIADVVGEFEGASTRGWYWKIRSMSPAAAKAQMLQDNEVLEIVEGKYIAREFYTGGPNGVWMDGYDEIGRVLRENKGWYGFMVNEGSIDPAFIKNGKFLRIVDQLDRQVTAARAAGDWLEWIFSEGSFPAAFQDYLEANRPDLLELMGTGDGKVFTFVTY